MRVMQTTFTPRIIRKGISNWINSDNYSHAITLNSDRELTLPKLKTIFSTFCYEFDKKTLGRNLKKQSLDKRFRAIAFPEHLSTNAHLHLAADLETAIHNLGDVIETKLVMEQ